MIATFKVLFRFAVVLLCAHGAAASAVTLGAARGGVLLGQPLDLSFAVTLDASTSADDTCAAVEVRQGEQRVEPARVRVSVERAAKAGDFNVRVRSSVPIEEPYVSVVLRAGCNQSVSRRYDFLTDLPTAVAPAAPAVSQATAAPVAAAAAAAPASSQGASTAAPPAAAPAAPAVAGGAVAARDPAVPRAAPADSAAAQRRPAPVAPRAQASTQAQGAARAPQSSTAVAGSAPPRVPSAAPAESAASSSGGSRLQLDAPSGGLTLGLRNSMALASLPEEAASPKRSEAQNLWRALNASADEVLADARRQEEAKAQSLALTQRANAQAAEIAALKAQLEEAERNRTPPWLWLALAGLALLALIAVGLWWRRRQAAKAATWYQSAYAEEPEDIAPTIQTPSYTHSARASLADGPPSRLEHDVDVNETPTESAMAQLETAVRESGAGPLMRGGAAPATAAGADSAKGSARLGAPALAVGAAGVAAAGLAANPGAAQNAAAAASAAGLTTSKSPTGRAQVALSPDEYLDVEQHADFFMSLGQYDQAIEVLQKHIAQFREATPLAFLDLLNVYHMLSRLDDFNRVRADFNRTFTGLVPEFSAFKGAGRGIADYTTAMGVINAHWGKPQVARTLEEMLFRRPEHAPADGFDIEAFRDLILLHQVARVTATSVVADEPATPTERDARQGTPSTWANSLFESDRLPLNQVSAKPVATPSSTLGLDPMDAALGEDGDLVVTDNDLDVDLSEPIGQDFVATQPPPEDGQRGKAAAKAAEPLDGLDIDFQGFDFEAPANRPAIVKSGAVDVDRPLSQRAAGTDPAKAAADRNLADFDFFDSELEAKLAPKKVDPRG